MDQATKEEPPSAPRQRDMDLIDRKILDLLQRDATLSIAEIADRVGLSQTPCWKRIQRLETQGIVEKRVALLNPEKLASA